MGNYYLGLDMGTSSVGWAVTDENYKLLKSHGKELWGIREFEEAETSADRRSHRINRRRRQREQVRIGLLKAYFDDAIRKVDPDFFIRLENSKYYPEDKDIDGKDGIFEDENYHDKDYYTQFPTIYHLRKELIENSEPHDVRLVYLALLNMYKHRGHFLNASLGIEDNDKAQNAVFDELNDCLSEQFGFSFSGLTAEDINAVLGTKKMSRTQKVEVLLEQMNLAGMDKEKLATLKLCAKMLCGLSVSTDKLFPDLEIDKMDICFAKGSFLDESEEIYAAVGEEYAQIIDLSKQLYDAGSLSAILSGHDYLSDARVTLYEKHKADLALLKQLVREKLSEEKYDALFRAEGAGSYSAYVNSCNSGSKNRRDYGGTSNRSRDALYATIKKMLAGVEDERAKWILDEISKESFLPKQLTSDNGVIPNQVHAKEMRKILSNAENYLPFLKEKDESGLTTSERILQLFMFQVPYYIGPTSENSANNNGNGWVIRKEPGQILPWNYQDKIDVQRTSEEFIKRLVRDCTYISGEKVLPKASLLYERYCVLNEINNIRIDGERIDVGLKQEIYTDLFLKGKKVTRKQLETYLVGKGVITNDSKEQLTGIDITINNALLSYGKFYAVFGEKMKEDSYRNMAEDMIYWITVYGNSKDLIKKQIKEKYSDRLSDQQLKRILGYKFKDWGNLSKEFLLLQGCDKSTGEVISLIQAMWDYNLNMMELRSSNAFTFAEALQEKQRKELSVLSEFAVEDLDEFYFSAPVKRMVWQTLQIIREIEKIQGQAPDRVFIEMTRSEGEKGDKGRKNSRKTQLLELYKSIKEEKRNWQKEIEKADESGTLRSKKMYLYYRQMGRCMYTGQPIDLDELFNDNLYDIDHIYPRHFVKDDNLENNLVLVRKQLNADKEDKYPLSEKILVSTEARELWKRLHELGFVNDEKYRRLTGRNPFSEEQKADFIARQMVETGQATKGVADILKQVLPQSAVVYAKAGNVSDFRRDYDLLKSRSVNDFHHAQDAYLNIVVGNVYYTKFTQNPLNYIHKEYAANPEKYNYNLGKMYARDVERNGKTAWIAPRDNEPGTILVVKKMMAKNTPLLTRMNFEVSGGIANATLYSKNKAKDEGYFPLKANDPKMQDVKKYGGYTSATITYFFLVEHTVKGKRVRSLEGLPLYKKAEVEKTENGLLEYCLNGLGLKDPRICVKKIKVQSLFKINGYYAHLSGKTNKQIKLRNAVSLCLRQEYVNYVKLLDNYVAEGRKSNSVSQDENIELYDILTEKHLNEIFAERPNPVGEKLKEGRKQFKNLSLDAQVKVLEEILKLSAIGLPVADLTEIGGAFKSGVMLCSKNIEKATEFVLINQSITGVFEQEIDLLTV